MSIEVDGRTDLARRKKVSACHQIQGVVDLFFQYRVHGERNRGQSLSTRNIQILRSESYTLAQFEQTAVEQQHQI